MRPWNLNNASMEIASRMNAIFSKSFVYRVNRFHALCIDATPSYMFFETPYNIHMVANKGGNTLEVYLNNGFNLSEYNDEELSALAYSIGHDIADRYAITHNKTGIIFFFDEDLNYPEYKHEYKFKDDHETKTIISDYPLLNHMTREFDVEFLTFNELGHDGILEISKNGKLLFDNEQFRNKPIRGIVRIEKTPSGFSVSLQDCNLFSARIYNLKVMSYIGQYCSLDRVPTHKNLRGLNPYVEIYFSANEYDFLVYVERIRNYGLTPQDLKSSIPKVCQAIGASSDVDWANYISM